MNERESFSIAVDDTMGSLTNRLHTVLDELLLKLYSCFTDGERQEIQVGGNTGIRKVEKFFVTLKTKDVSAYKRCLIALKELKHTELSEELEKKWMNAWTGSNESFVNESSMTTAGT